MAAGQIRRLDERSFEIDGHHFAHPKTFLEFLAFGSESDDEVLYVGKMPEIIEKYEDLARRTAPRTIVELGVFRGGSLAMVHQLARPDRVLGVELSTDPTPALDAYVSAVGDDTIRVECGVDQADADTVGRLVDQHLGPGRSIDLVIDDASHVLEPTRTSFETLFGRVRPGGRYVIEDYAAAHIATTLFLDRAVAGDTLASNVCRETVAGVLGADHRPMHVIAVEAMLASIGSPEIVASVAADRYWLEIVRGPADVDPDTPLQLRALADDRFSLLDTTPNGQLAGFLTAHPDAEG